MVTLINAPIHSHSHYSDSWQTTTYGDVISISFLATLSPEMYSIFLSIPIFPALIILSVTQRMRRARSYMVDHAFWVIQDHAQRNFVLLITVEAHSADSYFRISIVFLWISTEVPVYFGQSNPWQNQGGFHLTGVPMGRVFVDVSIADVHNDSRTKTAVMMFVFKDKNQMLCQTSN